MAPEWTVQPRVRTKEHDRRWWMVRNAGGEVASGLLKLSLLPPTKGAGGVSYPISYVKQTWRYRFSYEGLSQGGTIHGETRRIGYYTYCVYFIVFCIGIFASAR